MAEGARIDLDFYWPKGVDFLPRFPSSFLFYLFFTRVPVLVSFEGYALYRGVMIFENFRR